MEALFTGIVEEVGEIRGIKKGEKSSILSIKANKVIEDVKLGHLYQWSMLNSNKYIWKYI